MRESFQRLKESFQVLNKMERNKEKKRATTALFCLACFFLKF